MTNEAPDPTHSVQTRPTLLFRLRDWQDTASWAEFYRLYRKLVFSLGTRSGLTHSEAEDVTQDVFKRVAETIHEFEADPARGSFRGWLMNLTRWRIADKFRDRDRAAQLADKRGFDADPDRTTTLEKIPDRHFSGGEDADRGWEIEWQYHVMEAALGRVARRVPAKHFQAFDLHTRQGWSALRVARELGINIATIYVISHRITKQLKAEVSKLQTQLG